MLRQPLAAAVLLLLVVLACLSWRRWPNLLFDYGRELYVPWRLSAGQVLYTEVSYFNGPLSPYYHALLFKAFGVSWTVVIVSSLAVVAAITGGLYAGLGRRLDPLTAAAACVTFLSGFAFNLVRDGNYTFLCPYSHEMTHGVLLSLAMLVLLHRGSEDRRQGWSLAAGACFGLVWLTKAEIALAAGCAASASLWLLGSSRDSPGAGSARGKAAASFAGGAALVIAGAGALLWLAGGRPAVVQGLGGS
ncbi:MAG: glycosyltransferase family 39 protein, partial [Elusimicrobia bacterium]|nr:glycosyltransferase family 39 protein [Elusimicrobiota bacterium]